MTRILNEKWLTKVDFSKGVIELTEWEEKIYQQGKADAIEEIIEYYKPCNDCGACLKDDRDYFKKKCEMDMQISYTELVEDLKQFKEQKS